MNALKKRTKSVGDVNRMLKELQNIKTDDSNKSLKVIRRQTTKLSKQSTIKAAMAAIMPKDQYSSDRTIDRKDVFHRIFKGEKLTYEEMFRSRGFRGLNILPFSKGVKK